MVSLVFIQLKERVFVEVAEAFTLFPHIQFNFRRTILPSYPFLLFFVMFKDIFQFRAGWLCLPFLLLSRSSFDSAVGVALFLVGLEQTAFVMIIVIHVFGQVEAAVRYLEFWFISRNCDRHLLLDVCQLLEESEVLSTLFVVLIKVLQLLYYYPPQKISVRKR